MSTRLESMNDALFDPLTDDEQTALVGGKFTICGTIRVSGVTSLEFSISLGD